MTSIGLIFPDQLSKDNMVLKQAHINDLIIFYEPLETFYEINHHKHKLVFLISAFRHFKNFINRTNSLHEKISKKPKSSLLIILTIYTKKIHSIILWFQSHLTSKLSKT